MSLAFPFGYAARTEQKWTSPDFHSSRHGAESECPPDRTLRTESIAVSQGAPSFELRRQNCLRRDPRDGLPILR